MASTQPKTGRKSLGIAFFAGPVLWGIQLLEGYTLANFASNGASRVWYFGLSAVVVVGITAAMAIAAVSYRGLGREKPQPAGRNGDRIDRRRFVALSSIFMSSIFLYLAVITGAFAVYINPARLISMPFP